MSAEQQLNAWLQQYPGVKKVIKNIYQHSVYFVTPKIKSEGNLIKITPEDNFEYFFGYYNMSPWSGDGRYIITLRVKKAYEAVAPRETGELLLLDVKENYRIVKIADTRTWNVQQGCMAQWMGPDFNTRIIYNDFREGSYCCVVFNILTMKEEKVYKRAIYDIAKDGSYGLGLDFSRLHRMRPGYGYSNLEDSTEGELCPDKPCIWKIDFTTGKIIELLRYTDLLNFEPRKEMEGAEHKVNHIMINPNSNRFMILHRWIQKGKKFTRLITINKEGKELYVLSDGNFVSHCYWKNNEYILAFLEKKEKGRRYYLMKDQTSEYEALWSELISDGHPSYSPDGELVVTDTYPDRARMQSVYLCKGAEVFRLARVFAPFKYDNDTRCDLHPRWNRTSDQICIDSVFEGKRAMYIINLPSRYQKVIDKKEAAKIPKIIHYCWFGQNEKPVLVTKCIESWKKYLPDYEIMEWNESNFDVANTCQYVQDAFASKKWAFVSDYVRLDALYQYGGIYFDTDLEVVGGFNKFLFRDVFICSESKYSVCTAVIGAVKGSDLIRQIKEKYNTRNFIKADGELNLYPNTKMIQEFLIERYGYQYQDAVIEYDGCTIFTNDYFSPLNCYTNILKTTDNTVAIHHYDNSWKGSKAKLKKKVMAYVTRIIGEDMRFKISTLIKGL